mgnify:CR=1 FL=1
MDDKNTTVTDSQQTRAYAAYYGLWVGLCWAASFALTMYALSHPSVGSLGLILGLCSVPLGVWLMRGFRQTVAPLPLRRAWHMAWMMFLCAALLCSAAQHIYFAYIDGGLLVRSYSEMFQQPELHDMMQQMLPGQNIDTMMEEALTAFSTTPPSQLALQFLFWNVLLATFLAFPTALLSFSRDLP